MRAALALFIALPLVASAAEQATVVTQPAPAGTRGEVETETLVKMEMRLSHGANAVPVEIETEQIHFWNFTVVSNQGGLATVDMHYHKAWTQTEAMGTVSNAPELMQGHTFRVTTQGGVPTQIVQLPAMVPVAPEVAQVVAADLDWIDELLEPSQQIRRLRAGERYDTARLQQFIAGLGQGAAGDVGAVVRGPSSMAGRDTVAVDWRADAGWNDAGVLVRVIGEGVLHIDREFGMGTKLVFKGPLTLGGQKTVMADDGTAVQANVTGSGRLVLVSRLELDPP